MLAVVLLLPSECRRMSMLEVHQLLRQAAFMRCVVGNMLKILGTGCLSLELLHVDKTAPCQGAAELPRFVGARSAARQAPTGPAGLPSLTRRFVSDH